MCSLLANTSAKPLGLYSVDDELFAMNLTASLGSSGRAPYEFVLLTTGVIE